MLSEPLELGDIEATTLFDYLYDFFRRDFIDSRTYLAKSIWINPRTYRKEDGKEQDFWHLTSREEKERVWGGKRYVWQSLGRYPDYGRASRIEWVKQILVNHDSEEIKLFYHRESNRKRDIRLYLWAYNFDFVVILQKLGKSSSFLVTSFYIDHQGKRNDYEKRYENYVSEDVDLEGCEWF